MSDKGKRTVKQDVISDKTNNGISRGWLGAIGVLTLLLLTFVGYLGLWIFPVRTDRAKFIADGSLNVLILAAIPQ